ncbi:MAG TPA: protoporphyrinogen oxidase [Gaiellaceae bacterium]|nr:protoporphyrinogen oxidase [Gaiellaceae bacterium]
MTVAVLGGGIAGLAAARELESLLPDAAIVLLEREARFGGKIVTERFDGFVVEGAPDSFLARKERGVGLCEELGLSDELVGRRPENARTFVRFGGELRPLPSGLTGMIPTDLSALEDTSLLSAEGRERLAAEPGLPPAPPDGDESIAAFVSRRLGREAYERIVEPLMTGIYGGDGERLSLQATFPGLRVLELEHGSLLRGLAAQPAPATRYPPFVSLRDGMEQLVSVLAASLRRTRVLTGRSAVAVRRRHGTFVAELADGDGVEADGIVVATPADVTAELLAELDPGLAGLHAEIPHASSVVVTLGLRAEDVESRLAGYGYVVPRTEGSDVLACTWTSSKWEGRAPAGAMLVRVYAGRFGLRDLTGETDDALLALAREELRHVGIDAEPVLQRVHRWPNGMPQYVLGHPERLERIAAALEEHPRLALAGAAYRGVGLPDCIDSGEEAARSVARALRRRSAPAEPAASAK